MKHFSISWIAIVAFVIGAASCAIRPKPVQPFRTLSPEQREFLNIPEGRQTAFIHAARCDRYGDVYLTICVEGLDERVKRSATAIASRLASRPHEVITCMDGNGSFVGIPMQPSRGEWSVDADVDFGKSDQMMKVDWFDSKQPEVSRRGRKWFCRGIVKLPMPMTLTPGTSVGFFSQSNEYTWYLADEFVYDTARVRVEFADR